MKRIVKWVFILFIGVNLGNKVVEILTLNVKTVFVTTCDMSKSFSYTTGFGSGCTSSYWSMSRCFKNWKKNNNIQDCDLLRTESMSILNVHKWLDYIFHPKWHYTYIDRSKIK